MRTQQKQKIRDGTKKDAYDLSAPVRQFIGGKRYHFPCNPSYDGNILLPLLDLVSSRRDTTVKLFLKKQIF